MGTSCVNSFGEHARCSERNVLGYTSRGLRLRLSVSGLVVGERVSSRFLMALIISSIAAVVDLKLVPRDKHSWRSLFWLGAGLSLATAIFRAVLPESQVFLRAREEARAKGALMTEKQKTKVFLHETGVSPARTDRSLSSCAMLTLGTVRLCFASTGSFVSTRYFS